MAHFIVWIVLCHMVAEAGAGRRRPRSLTAGAGARGPSTVDRDTLHSLDPYGSGATGVNSLPVPDGRDPILDPRPSQASPILLDLTPFGVFPSSSTPLSHWQRGFELEPPILHSVPVSHSLGVSGFPGGAGDSPTPASTILSLPGLRTSASSPDSPLLPFGVRDSSPERGVARLPESSPERGVDRRPGLVVAGPLRPASKPVSRITGLKVILYCIICKCNF